MSETTFKPGAPDTGTVNLSSGSVSFPIILASLPGRNGLDFDLSAQYSSMGIRESVDTWTVEAPTGVMGLGWAFPQEQIVRIWNGSTQESTYGLCTENTLYALVKGGADAAGEIYESTSYQFWKIRYQPERELWAITKEDGTCSFYGGNVQQAAGHTNTSQGNSIEWGVRWGTWTGPSNVAAKQEQFPVAWNLSSVENIWGDRVTLFYEQDQQLVGTAGATRKHYTQACRLRQVIGATGESMLLHYGPEDGAENPYEMRVKEHTLPGGGPDAYQDRLERHFLDALEVLNANGELVSHVQLRYASLGSGDMRKQILKSITFSNNQGHPYGAPQLFAYYGETSADGVSVSRTDASKVAHGGALFGALKSVTAPQGATTSYQYTELTIPNARRDLDIPCPGHEWHHPLTYMGLDYTVVIWHGTGTKKHQIHLSVYQWVGRWVATTLNELTVGDATDIQVEIAPAFFAIITPGQAQTVHLFHKRPYSHGGWRYYSQSIGTLADCLIASGNDFFAILDQADGKLYCFTYNMHNNVNNWESSHIFDEPLKTGEKTMFALTAGNNYLCTVSAVPDRAFQPEIRLYSLDTFGKWHKLPPYTNEHFVPKQEHLISTKEQFLTFDQLSLEGSTTFVSLLLSGLVNINMRAYQLFVFRWSETALEAERLPLPETFYYFPDVETQLSVLGDMVVLSPSSTAPKSSKVVYQYTGERWLSREFSNDSRQNNYLGPDSFSTTQNGQAQYWQFNPNTSQWENGAILPYKDGNLTLFEKFWSIIWPSISLLVGIVTLPLSFGAGLLVDLALLPFDLYALLMVPGTAGGGHSSGRFFTGDNYVYAQDATGTWSRIGELLTEAEKAERPVPGEGTTFETQSLQFQNTQSASTFIAYAITQKRQKILRGGSSVIPQGYPKYISKIQLLKNGAFLSSATTLPPHEKLQRSAGDESNLIGWNAFLTFNGSETLSEATSLKLHRVIQDDFQGPLKSDVVSQVSIHDGYEETHTHYDYNTASAQCLPIATTAFYNKVTTLYSGASTTATRNNGYTESYFYIGDTTALPNQPDGQTSTNSADYPALLTGRLYATRVFDGTGHQVAATTHSWLVFERSLLGRGTGCSFFLVKEEVESDGSKKVTENDYAVRAYDGFPGITTVSNYDVSGRQEAISTLYHYGCDLYPELKERHILASVAQTSTHTNGIMTAFQTATWLPTPRFPFRLTPGQDLPPQFQGSGWSVTEENSVSTSASSILTSADEETTAIILIPPLTLIPDFSGKLHFTYDCTSIEAQDLLGAVLEVRVDHAKVWDNKGNSSGYGDIELRQSYQRVEWLWTCEVRCPADGNTMVTVSIGDISIPRLAPAATYQAKKPLDFQAYSEFASPDWLKTSEVVARHPLYGLATEIQDVDAVTSSIIYDTNYQFPVARFAHASVEKHEAGYYGFEDYENQAQWQLTGTPGETVSAYAGQKAYSGSDIRIEPRTFTPRSATTPYVVSAWVKTRRGGHGARIGFGDAGITIGPHKDDWQYVEYVTRVPDMHLKPFASCDGAIDDFRFGPVDAPFSALVYDPFFHLVTAQLGTNGETVRFIYDDLQTLIAMTGPDGTEVSHLMSEKHSRDGNEPFKAARPNQKLSLLPRSGGHYYRTLADYPGDKEVHADYQGGPTTYVTQRVTPPAVNYGLKLRISAPMNRRSRSFFSIVFGARVVRCDADHTVKLTSVMPKAYPGEVLGSFPVAYDPLDGAEWMLILLEKQALFFLDGEFLFSEKLSENPSNLVLLWGSDETAIAGSDVFVFSDPIVELQYTDGLDRVIQTLHLDQPAEGTIASQILYDGWGHPAVTTKPLLITKIALAYQSNLVKTFDWSSGKMTGEVVDYYSRVQAPDQQQNDALYPYSRQVAEANPLARIYEITQPGVDFQAGSLQIEQMKFDRTAEVNALLADLGLTDKASYYTALTTHHPFDGHKRSVTTRLFDLQGTLIALRHGQGTTAQTSIRSMTHASDGTSTITFTQPNAFAHWKEQANRQHRTTLTRDFLGRAQASTDSDSNAQQCIYDQAGRLRFKLDAEGAAQNPHRILYWRYDAFGRILAEGMLHQQWNREQLQREADGPLPGEDTSANWTRCYVYDMNRGSVITNLKGRLAEVITRDQDLQGHMMPRVRESFAYDLAGNLVETGLIVEAFDAPGKVSKTRYEYNKLKQVTKIIYPYDPSGQPDLAVHYLYSPNGQLASIGTADDSTRDAVYEYNLDGSIKTELLNKQRLHYTHSYDFQGHLLSLKDQQGFFSEELRYRDANGIFKDGNVVSATFTGSALSRPHGYTYQYDTFGRLTAAQTVAAKAGTVPQADWDLQKVEYDANGNLLHMQQGQASSTYQYTPGTNQLKDLQHRSADQDQPGLEAYEHNLNGWITKSGEIDTISYNPQTALPVEVRAGERHTSLFYGGRRQRVLKTTGSGQNAPQEQRLYVHGASAYPLVEYTQAGRTCYIYGPGGLLAQSEDAQTFTFFLKDHLGSTRVVLNEENQPIAAFQYLPFGSIVPDNSGSQEALHRFRYLFTGQEYDEEIGLHNYRARMYKSDLGRFLTPDPKREFPSPYVYVNNNPLNLTDPTGEMMLALRAARMVARRTAGSGWRAGARLPLRAGLPQGARFASGPGRKTSWFDYIFPPALEAAPVERVGDTILASGGRKVRRYQTAEEAFKNVNEKDVWFRLIDAENVNELQVGGAYRGWSKAEQMELQSGMFNLAQAPEHVTKLHPDAISVAEKYFVMRNLIKSRPQDEKWAVLIINRPSWSKGFAAELMRARNPAQAEMMYDRIIPPEDILGVIMP